MNVFGADACHRLIGITFMALVVLVASAHLSAAGEQRAGHRMPFVGRLLALELSGHSRVRLVQLQSVSEKWNPVGTAPVGFGGSVSPDAKRVVDAEGVLGSFGARQRVHLLDAHSHLEDAGFSPDGSQLAYAYVKYREDGNNQEAERLVVRDLTTGAEQVVLETPCEDYVGGAAAGRACGMISAVRWFDATTLLALYFAGPPPSGTECRLEGGCDSFPANTYSLIASTGGLLASAPAPCCRRGEDPNLPEDVRGSAVLLDDGRWFDAREISTGTILPKEVADGTVLPCLSPDGTRAIVHRKGKPWAVVVLADGSETTLGTRGDLGEDCVWSPDGMQVAVQDNDSVSLVPVSSQRARRVADLTTFASKLVNWLPGSDPRSDN